MDIYADNEKDDSKRIWLWIAIAGVLAVLVFVIGALVRHKEAGKPPPVHPLFGAARQTEAVDVTEIPYTRPMAPGPRGFDPNSRVPVSLSLGMENMEWAMTDSRLLTGVLYFSGRLTQSSSWMFAPCAKPSLLAVTKADLNAPFYTTNDAATGPAAFGTNWLTGPPTCIQVQPGQIILARLANDRSKIYIIEITKQVKGRLSVNYVVVPASQ